MSAQLERGAVVRIEIPGERPYIGQTRMHVRRLHGVYLGIPRFETSIANVRVGGQVRRFPLEYLSAVTS